MANIITRLSVLLTFMFFIISCEEVIEMEPCSGVFCPKGYTCYNGSCIVDPEADPCDFVNCPPGFNCQEGDCISNETPVKVISGVIDQDESWVTDTVYELAGKVIVPDGVTLTIGLGTIIKGRQGSGYLASALIISRGAKIIAEGTPASPIVFTTVEDNIQPGEIRGRNLRETDNDGFWGGLIILGDAPVSSDLGDTESNLSCFAENEDYGLYGGDNENDNSGKLKHVSIRHSGEIAPDGSPYPGLTLAGVGAGTELQLVEVFASSGDGLSILGGTFDMVDFICTYQGDDAINIDENYDGTIDNFMVIHGEVKTDQALEIQGPKGPTHTNGRFQLQNGTFKAVDGELTRAGLFINDSQGFITDCAWIGYDDFMLIQTSFDPDAGCTVLTDAYSNLLTAELKFSNNEIEVQETTLEAILTVFPNPLPGQEECFQAFDEVMQNNADARFELDGNLVVDTGASTIGVTVNRFFGWTITAARGLIP